MFKKGERWRIVFLLLMVVLLIVAGMLDWMFGVFCYFFIGFLIWAFILGGRGKWYLMIAFWMPMIAFSGARDFYVDQG